MKDTPTRLTRRQCVSTLCGAPTAMALAGAASAAGPIHEGPWSAPPKIAKVYLTGTETHLPHPDIDVAKEMKRIDAEITAFARRHPEVEFTGGELLTHKNELEGWARSVDADALLIIPVTTPALSVSAVLEARPLPALVLVLPHASHTWASISRIRKEGKWVDVLPTSDVDALESYLPVFRSIHHLGSSKVLLFAANETGSYHSCDVDFTKHFGTEIRRMPFKDLYDVFESADPAQAKREAEEFKRLALRIVEPDPAEIDSAMRFYLGLRRLLETEKANAVTIDCFPAVVRKTIPAYPCIAWSKLNDLGLYGVCQADIRATMTQLLLTPISQRPGFVSNPVFDVPQEEVLHTHCVAATRILGFNEPACPFLVRSHTETNEGAVLQVVMPADHDVTVGIFNNPARFLVSRARVKGSIGEVTGSRHAEMGCRTKIRTSVPKAEEWLENYTTAVHRVVFYGDHLKAVERTGRMMGFETVHET